MSKGKKEKDFKFIVGTTDFLCSLVWSVKIRKDDVYIMNDNGKEHKISLHASGICHSAVTQESRQKFRMTPEQRRAVEWTIDLDNGADNVYNILVPYSQLKDLSNNSSVPESALRIPTPPVDSAVVIKFYKTKSNVREIEFVSPYTIHRLHSVQLASGENLLIVYAYTTIYNNVISNALAMIAQYADSIRKRPNCPKLTRGFVHIESAEHEQFRIDYWF